MTQMVEQRARATGATVEFDGVICFGGVDWWYHNRGHYDIQMMREFSQFMPVLYVNSIGMRMPKASEGRMFAKRIARKLRSFSRGVVRVRENFAVFSPMAVPGKRGMALSRRLLGIQVRRAAARMGIRRPLVWIACPPAVESVEKLNPVAVVYQRTDRFEAFRGIDPAQIKGYDTQLKARADVTVYCSSLLFDEEQAECRHAAYVDHGVDYAPFRAAGDDPESEPSDVRAIARPRVGFIGGIDAHTFDPQLFVDVASRLVGFQFVMVGACSLPEGWCKLPNVTFLGQRPYDQVAAYMAASDVLIMPWNRSEWIKACNPVKLKEYLAVGRPIVTTSFYELCRYEGLVHVANTAEAFASAVRDAATKAHDPEPGRERVCRSTWTDKAMSALRELEAVGFKPLQHQRVAGRQNGHINSDA